ncbi:MAG: type V CRISPR-associated endonuclease Cas1 [Spirochaetia bacterium]|nr:type V CRISPR-associated endonuclease Cas1 [Spirochaetia bacterium]
MDFTQKQIAFVFLDEGECVSFKNDNIIVKDAFDKIKHQSTCYRLFALFLCGHICLTSGLLERASKFGFSIVFMNHNMRVIQIIAAKAEGNVLLRKKQYVYDKTEIASHIISNKILNQVFQLKKRRNKTDEEKEVVRKLEQYSQDVLTSELSVQEIMGIEGVSAKIYFNTMFKKYDWTARCPRAKQDVINCLMDIGYTILFNIVNALLEMYGFDVYVGILHTQFFHRKSLVCDLEEPFRPIIDAAILKMLNLGQVDEQDFWKTNGQYLLVGKKAVPYLQMLIAAILEYKDDIFLYLQSYYRAFVRSKPISDFPVFIMEKK